jgi:hypothetical protein
MARPVCKGDFTWRVWSASTYPVTGLEPWPRWNARASGLIKVLHAAEQERTDVARARRRWIREQGLLDTTHLVIIDETSVNTHMTRMFGRAPRGERVIGRVPFSA